LGQNERALDFLYGALVGVLGNFLVSSIVGIDESIFGNASSMAIGFWGFSFILSSLFFFYFTKQAMRRFLPQSDLSPFNWAILICIILGVVVIAFAALR